MFTSQHLRQPRRDRAILVGSLTALAAVAWVSLWAWSASPWSSFLGHGDSGVAGTAGHRPRRTGRPGGALRRRLDPDDRGDDAAVERSARPRLRGGRQPPAGG